MRLKAALRVNGKVYSGDERDSHDTLALREGIDPPSDSSMGFTPDGKQFLSRSHALGFLKRHDYKTYARLPEEAEKGLHSHHLAEAYGVTQRKLKGADAPAPGPEAPSDGVDLSSKTAIVYDRGGLYLYAAEKLAEKYKEVMYYLADADAYPTSQKQKIGSGLGVTRIYDFWRNIDDADIVYFFDCYDGELQHWLRGKGYTVFGSGRGEAIEIDKVLFLETLEKLGLPCPKTYVAEGLDDLMEYLDKHDGETLFLKNLHRGDFESRKFVSQAQSRPFFSDLKKRLGSSCESLKVLVQHKIEAECEAGYDGFLIDGEFTDNCIVGYEIKDQGFVAKIAPETPEILKCINLAFSDTFKSLGYRGNYSTEVRITSNGTPYYIDATARIPSPPGELICEIYENWAEATWQIAHGEVPCLVPRAAYGAEIILTSGWHDQHELHVKFPPSMYQNVKLKNHALVEGEYYCVPNGNGEFFGAVVAWGDTLDEAIAKALEVAEAVEADELKFNPELFAEAKKQIEGGEKFGISYEDSSE